MTPGTKAFLMLRYLGPRWALSRLQVLARRHLPSRRVVTPAASLVPEVDPATRFRARLGQSETSVLSPDPALEARFRDVERGSFEVFGVPVVTGCPPDWLRNAQSGLRYPLLPWQQIDEFAHGDIKFVWELSRFSFAFDLVRAGARGHEQKASELFWKLFLTWREANPAGLGPNWKCGQEASLRLIAVLFAAAHLPPPDDRYAMSQLAAFVSETAERVVEHVQYAISQENNHAISEAAGLYTAAAVFPMLPGASAWRLRGETVLARMVSRLIDEDGGFSQYSTNYQRLVLDTLTWVIRLAQHLGADLPPIVSAKTRAAARLLHDLADPATGRVPNAGANDGALLLHLSAAPCEDFRPSIAAALAACGDRPDFLAGDWLEQLAWLGLALPETAPLPRRAVATSLASGYHFLRSTRSAAFLRGAKYRFRPSQADQLHVELLFDGVPVLMDSGTLQYRMPDGSADPFAGSRFHNVVTIDDRDQMERVSRFLWLPWRDAHVEAANARSRWSLRGRLPLGRGRQWERTIILYAVDSWAIVDVVRTREPARHQLSWLLADHRADTTAFGVSLQPPGMSIELRMWLDGSPVMAVLPSDDPRNQYATHYGRSAQGQRLVATHDAALLSRFVTTLSPFATDLVWDREGLLLNWTEGGEPRSAAIPWDAPS